MAQIPSNLAAVPSSDPEAGESLPSDLMGLGLEDLMGLRAGSRADPDRDDAPRDRDRPQETLPAGAPAVTAPGGATRPADAEPWGELPADLTALSLAQLMNLPLRAPQTEPEAESELAEEGAEDETVPAVAQTQAGHGSEEAEAPPRAATGAVGFAVLLDAHDDAGPDSAAAFGTFGPTLGGGGGGGNLNLIGGAGHDVLAGGAGADSLRGLAGDDSLTGKGGAETLIGDAGQDTLLGGAGADTLDGGNGKDTLDGGAGNDRLDGGNGKDTLLGGAGDDSLVWDKVDGVIDGGAGDDTLLAGGGDVRLTSYSGAITSIERVELSGDGAGTRLTLDAQDVLDMNSADTLTVSGDVGDRLEAGTGWTDGGVVGAFHVYSQGLATLAVDLDVTVNADITL